MAGSRVFWSSAVVVCPQCCAGRVCDREAVFHAHSNMAITLLLIAVISLPCLHMCVAAPYINNQDHSGDTSASGQHHFPENGDSTDLSLPRSSGDEGSEKQVSLSGDSLPFSRGSGNSDDDKLTSVTKENILPDMPKDFASFSLEVEAVSEKDVPTITPSEKKVTKMLKQNVQDPSSGESSSGFFPDLTSGLRSSDTTDSPEMSMEADEMTPEGITRRAHPPEHAGVSTAEDVTSENGQAGFILTSPHSGRITNPGKTTSSANEVSETDPRYSPLITKDKLPPAEKKSTTSRSRSTSADSTFISPGFSETNSTLAETNKPLEEKYTTLVGTSSTAEETSSTQYQSQAEAEGFPVSNAPTRQSGDTDGSSHILTQEVETKVPRKTTAKESQTTLAKTWTRLTSSPGASTRKMRSTLPADKLSTEDVKEHSNIGTLPKTGTGLTSSTGIFPTQKRSTLPADIFSTEDVTNVTNSDMESAPDSPVEATTDDGNAPVFSTKDNSDASSQNAYETIDNQTTVAPTTREILTAQNFTTAVERGEKSSDFTSPMLSWKTSHGDEFSAPSRTRRQTGITDADTDVGTTGSDSPHITHLQTDDTTVAVSSPGDATQPAGPSTTALLVSPERSTEKTVDTGESTATPVATTTSTPTTTTTTTTTRPKPQNLGDSCLPGDDCGSIANSSCINNTCACVESYYPIEGKCFKEPYDLDVAQTADQCVTVSWEGARRNYTVSVVSPDAENQQNVSHDTKEKLFCKLIPGSTLKISVQLLGGGEIVSSNITLRPTIPQNLRTGDTNETCFTVTWSKGSGNADDYLVSVKGKDVQQENITREESWTQCGLTPGRQYDFSVFARSKTVQSKYPRNVSVTTRPGTPVNGSAEYISLNCIHLTWSAGEGEAADFMQTMSPSRWRQPVIVSADNNRRDYSKKICNLHSGTRYEFKIVSRTNSGKQSMPLLLSACTAPSPVQGLRNLSVETTSVALEWDTLVNGGKDGYLVRWKGAGQDAPRDANITSIGTTSHTIDGLKPGTFYNISVSTYFCGLSSPAASVQVTTKQGDLYDVKVLPDDTRLNITWTNPGLPVLVELKVVAASSKKEIFKERVTTSPQIVETESFGQCFVVFLNVVQGSSYHVYESTEEAAPGRVQRLQTERLADNRTAMNVTWSAPNVTNGVIRTYDVTVTGRRGLSAETRTFDACTSACSLGCQTISEGDALDKRDHFSVLVNNLSSYENYDVTVVAFTSVGPGLPSQVVTKDQLPAMVETFSARPFNSTCIQLTWDYPENANASAVTRFSIQYVKRLEPTESFILNTTDTSHLVCQLDFWTEYEFSISAFNLEGEGETTSETARSGEHAPGKVESLRVRAETNRSEPRKITVEWVEPSDKYGRILAYFVIVELKSSGVVIKDKQVKPGEHTSGTYVTEMPDLEAETDYVVKVFGATKAGNGTVDSRTTRIEAGALPRPQAAVSVSSVAQGLGDGTTTLTLALPTELLCDWSYGQPAGAGFIVGRTSSKLLDKSTDGPRPDVTSSWLTVDREDEGAVYFVHLDAQRMCKERTGNKASQPIQVVVGADGDCADKGSANRNFCNGGLQPDTSYRFQGVFCTSAACTYSAPSSFIKTDRAPVTEGSDTAGVAAGVSVAFLLVFLGSGAAFYFVRRRRRTTPPPTQHVMNPLEDVPRTRPVRLDGFLQHVDQLHLDSNLGFSDEYKLVKEISREYSTNVALLPPCKPKNRYTNILPWDHSRVKLQPADDEEGSDYINANYIPGEKHQREYIAAQGPLEDTVDDFWRMVWENKVSIIVMLTQCVEKGKVKCEKYWPEQGASHQQFHGDLCVQTRSESVLPDYVIRVIDISLGNHTRMIKQFHFIRWPDHGCPERPALLLNFVSAVRGHMPHIATGPTLVHCSAGVGRTGTFIALDMLLQQIRRPTEVDIFGLVLKMRDNRTLMVQTESQYVYIHDCVVHALTAESEEESEEEEEEDEHIYGNC